VTLSLRGYVDLPRHASGGFDHGDVDQASGRMFVAHTANGTVEVVDGVNLTHLATLPDCPEASGVLCVQDLHLTFAAARAAGKVLLIDSESLAIRREISVGPKPNGLAWDSARRRLLVADVEDFRARIFSLDGGLVAMTALSGRPRWCVYDRARDRYLVNVREPAVVDVLAAGTGERVANIPIPVAGPHGLDLDDEACQAFVAADGGEVVRLDLVTNRPNGSTPIAGEPDAIWLNRERHRLYVAIGKPSVIDVVDAATLSVVEQVPTEEGAHTTAFDPSREWLYVFLPRSCRAAVYAECG
jgi:DNA-binding beta-propeller fold protein YncE